MLFRSGEHDGALVERDGGEGDRGGDGGDERGFGGGGGWDDGGGGREEGGRSGRGGESGVEELVDDAFESQDVLSRVGEELPSESSEVPASRSLSAP